MIESVTEVIERFVDEATKAGSIVYKAASSEEANKYIVDMAKERNMRSVVKSKSILANKIGLRQHLHDQGLSVTESDIAEWIAQMSGEESISVPVRNEEMVKVLSKGTASELKSDPEKNLEIIRTIIREILINADIGVSNADIAVAETGSCIMASDEGNDRLVSLLPRIHITLIEQHNIIATWEDAINKFRSLYGDRQGWRMPSFVTYLTGRNTTGDIPGAMRARAQGPEEEHIVIVDIL